MHFRSPAPYLAAALLPLTLYTISPNRPASRPAESAPTDAAMRGAPASIEAAAPAPRPARLLVEEPRVVEVDLNPVFAYPDGAIAVDARVLA